MGPDPGAGEQGCFGKGFLGPAVRFCMCFRAGLAMRKPQEGEIAPSTHLWAEFFSVSFGVLVSAAWSRTVARPGSLPQGQASLTG